MALFKFRMGIMLFLKSQGFKVIAIAPPDMYSKKIMAAGIRFFPVKLGTHGTNPLKDALFFLQLLRLYTQLKPSIIFHYTVKPNIYGNLAARLAGRIPSISIVPGRGYSFHKNDWLFKLVKLFYRLSLGYSREIWFLNEEDRQFFVSERMVDSPKTVVLPGEGVDTSFYTPGDAKNTPEKDGLTFLLSGRMLWEKGVGDFVEAARLVRKKYPSSKFHLLGFLDPDDTRVVPVNTIQEWVAEGIVSFMGVAEDVRPYFHKADCFVLPSFYGEGLPRTLLEAASMEIPIITSDHRGCRRAVIPGESGFLCKPCDVAGLAGRMMDLIQLPVEKRIEMGRKGREFVQNEYEEQLLVAFYTSKVEQLLNHSFYFNGLKKTTKNPVMLAE